MKKIMFNDRYNLTEAVINGTKTQTRRIMNVMFANDPKYLDKKYYNWYSRYKIGEEVAVAMSYYDAQDRVFYETGGEGNHGIYDAYRDTAGWKNKMFVKAELMPYRIRIKDIRVERLQDISDEDCIKEGIIKTYLEVAEKYIYFADLRLAPVDTPREAFGDLFCKIQGKRTWEENPWVWVYDFELIKER